MNSLEIKDQREQLKKRAFEIIDNAKKELSQDPFGYYDTETKEVVSEK